MKRLSQAALLSVMVTVPAFAGGGDFKPIMVAGITNFSGDTKNSMVANTEKFLSLTGEQADRRLRFTVSSDFGTSSGSGYVNSRSVTYSILSVALGGGALLFPFKDSGFQPFFGFKGVFGLHRFSLTNPPGSLPESSQGFHYGWEVPIGIDLRFKRGGKGIALRVYGSIRSVTGSAAEQSGFNMGGFRLGFGLVF